MNYSDDATIRQLIQTNASDLFTAFNYNVFNDSVTSVQVEHSHTHCFNWKTKFVQKPKKIYGSEMGSEQQLNKANNHLMVNNKRINKHLIVNSERVNNV